MNPHSAFFSSLRQVERRLQAKNATQTTSSRSKPQTPKTNGTTCQTTQEIDIFISESNKTTKRKSPESTRQEEERFSGFGSPIYIKHQCPKLLSVEGSEPPPEFLSQSPEFEFSPETNIRLSVVSSEADRSPGDEISELWALLGIADLNCGEKGNDGKEKEGCFCSFFCGGFLSKMGVKGPRCDGEMRRLEGWIDCFSKIDVGSSKRREPLRLAHLLLAKAAVEEIGGRGCIVFPDTAQEFLQRDPPSS